MLICPIATQLLLTFLAPAGALSPAESTALHACFDPSLAALRAGRDDAPAALGAHERAGLAAAQQRSQPLEALRAGFEPSDNDWKWIAIGGAVVLLIILI